MKKAIIAILLSSLLFTIRVSGQSTYEPQILVLSPGHVEYDKAFEKEVTALNNYIKLNTKSESLDQMLNSEDFKKQPPNLQRMIKSAAEFSKNADFTTMASYLCQQFLTYHFIEKFPNLMILLKDTKTTGKPGELKKLSEETQLQYVLNIPNLVFYKENGRSYAKLSVRFYDHSTNSLLIDTTYIGDWNNRGFEFACQDSTISCTINNSVAQVLDEVIYKVAANSPTLQKERKLAGDRANALRNNYFSRSFDKSFIASIILPADSAIILNNLYQLLISDDKTKFVGFFLEKRSRQNLGQLNKNKEDNNVRILNDKDIRDTGYLNNIPQTYAYIVKGVRYEGKWYYEKSEVTYFQPHDDEEGRLEYFNSLQHWGFFKDNSTAFNPDFWETNLFKKVKDLRKDPDWDKYGTTIWKTEEEENRNYIGLYEIVADQLKPKKMNRPKIVNMN